MILLIGLDAFDYRWRGHLEKYGFHTARLRSPHATSGPAWNSIMSGLRAETHQYAGQPAVGPGRPKPLMANPPPYLWDHLQANGKESVVINVPFIWPPGLARLFVCGYPAPERRYTFPANARERWPHSELDMVNYNYVVGEKEWADITPEEYRERVRTNRWVLAHRLRLEFEENGLPDLCVFCLTDLDRLSHRCAKYGMSEWLEEELDDVCDLVERLAGNCGATWNLVVSDHGCSLEKGIGFTHGPKIPGTEFGIFAWRGPDATPLAEETEVALEDVLPTVLWLLESVPAFPIEGVPRTGIAAARDEEALKMSLEALGYVG